MLVLVLVLVIVIESSGLANMHFDHEKLDVYKVSLEFSGFIAGLLDGLKGNHRHLKDQLARASLSIPLNIAEGNGKRSLADRRRFFEIARGSAMECSATLDVLVVYGAFSKEEIEKGKLLLFRIVSMLSRMTEPKGDSFVRESESEYGLDNREVIDYDYEHEHEHEEKG